MPVHLFFDLLPTAHEAARDSISRTFHPPEAKKKGLSFAEKAVTERPFLAPQMPYSGHMAGSARPAADPLSKRVYRVMKGGETPSTSSS
jgi:hypothetical protein